MGDRALAKKYTYNVMVDKGYIHARRLMDTKNTPHTDKILAALFVVADRIADELMDISSTLSSMSDNGGSSTDLSTVEEGMNKVLETLSSISESATVIKDVADVSEIERSAIAIGEMVEDIKIKLYGWENCPNGRPEPGEEETAG